MGAHQVPHISPSVHLILNTKNNRKEWLKKRHEYLEYLQMKRHQQGILTQCRLHPEKAPDYTRKVIVRFTNVHPDTNKGVLIVC